MNKATKRILHFTLAFFMIAFLLPQNILTANAATNATVYEYAPMLEDGGNIYYVQRVEKKENLYVIYRLEIATGNKTKLLSSKKDILGMMLHNDTLYYTSYEGEKDIYKTYSVSIDAKEKKTICNGYFQFLDDSSIYYTVTKGEESKLYKRDYDSKKASLVYTGNMTLKFVKGLDKTLYFTEFNEASSKLTLYSLLPEQTKLSVVTTEKIPLDEVGRMDTIVSDIVIINGDIYYQYGNYQGSGNYWYGILKKIDSTTNKKSVISKYLYNEIINHDEKSIFYIKGLDSANEYYIYNTKTNKTSSLTYKTTAAEFIDIQGETTYSTKDEKNGLISISRFTSGTNKKNLVDSFIKFTYKYNKKYDYSTTVKKYGDYLLIPLRATDYNDSSRGWRGKVISVTWYVFDSEGKMLTQFK